MRFTSGLLKGLKNPNKVLGGNSTMIHPGGVVMLLHVVASCNAPNHFMLQEPG